MVASIRPPCSPSRSIEGFDAYAMTFRYGQRHIVEIECAQRVARALGAHDHVIVDFDLRQFGGSALTSDIAVPKDRSATEMSHGIPITYVPARNTIFLSFALAWAETLGANDIFIGVNALDYTGYPDCRPEYIAAYRDDGEPRHQGRRGGHAALDDPCAADPALEGRDHRAGLALGVDYALTSSCYDPAPDGACAASAIPACSGTRASRRTASPIRSGIGRNSRPRGSRRT